MRGPPMALSLLLASLALLPSSSCKKSAPPPLQVRVTRITVSDADGSQTGADPQRVAALSAAAQRGLGRAGVAVEIDPATTTAGDFQLRMQLQVHLMDGQPPAPDPAKPGAGAVPLAPRLLRVLCAGMASARSSSLVAEAPGPGDAKAAPTPELTKLEHVALTEKSIAGEPTAAEVIQLVDRLVEDGAQTLGTELGLLGADARALIAVAGEPSRDAELRRTAIQILGLRKEPLAVPVFIGMVKDRDSDHGTEEKPAQRGIRRALRDSAIGALVAIGDRSAVRPLLNSVAFQDETEMGKIVEAVASLGGDEARQYLQFVKSSHPEAAIRTDAAAALQRLEQRAKLAKSPPASSEPTPSDSP